MASSAIYRDLLLKHRHGLPLWIPDPDENLEEHKKQGISIGDLGLLTEDGGFEYLFNIHVDADHSVNKDMVIPPSFTPLPLPRTSKHAYHDQKACITQNARFDIGGTIAAGVNLGPGAGVEVELDFTTTDERAAMLYLPHGADREDTTARGLYRKYAAQYGESWYKFVNGELDCDARNGSLYLVTGCDKSGSWALAAGAPQTGSSVQFKIRAGPLAVAAVTEGFHVSWSNTGGVERRHYPPSMKDSVEVKNQCVFVRGLTIAIRTSWFTKPLRGKVEINEINTSTQSFPAAGKDVPFGSMATQSSASRNVTRSSLPSLGEGSDQGHDATYLCDSENISGVLVEDYPKSPKAVLSPGSYICERLLSTQRYLNLVIVHDNDWMTVVSSDDETVFTSDGTDYERLTTHVLQKCHLQVTRGTALLRRPYHDLAATIEGAILDLLSEMKDKYQGVKVTAALLILIDELSKRSHLTTAIINTIPEILNARKEKGSEPQVSSTPASVSGEGLSQPYSAGTTGRGSLSSATNFTPGKWGKNHYTANFARAESAISESSKTMGVIECLGSLKDEDASIREAAVSTIAQCSKQPSDITAIMEGIPDILNLLKDRDSGVRRAAVSTMAQFSKQPELVMAIEKCISDILLFLKDENWRVREAAAGAIGEFSKQLDLVIAIESAMPILLTSLKQGNSDVRVAIISVIHALYKQCIISL